MIQIEQLAFAYPDSGFELRTPDLTDDDEEAVGLVGPSGSGKSTLLHLVAGILQPDAGSIEVAGARVDRMGES